MDYVIAYPTLPLLRLLTNGPHLGRNQIIVSVRVERTTSVAPSARPSFRSLFLEGYWTGWFDIVYLPKLIVIESNGRYSACTRADSPKFSAKASRRGLSWTNAVLSYAELHWAENLVQRVKHLRTPFLLKISIPCHQVWNKKGNSLKNIK